VKRRPPRPGQGNQGIIADSVVANVLAVGRGASAKSETLSPGPEPVERRRCRLLFLAANPRGMTQLALDEESRAIDQRIGQAEYRDAVDQITKWAVNADDLLQFLNKYRPDIVHFSGHGSDSEELFLEDATRAPHGISTQALRHLFTTLKDNVRVVVLNACYSRPQAEAITQVIDCAVGMRRAIGDRAAITFSGAFYRALAFGRSVQEAFDQGIAALMLEGIPEESTPELLLRDGVSASAVRLVGHPTE
jgi:hypothetical protein